MKSDIADTALGSIKSPLMYAIPGSPPFSPTCSSTLSRPITISDLGSKKSLTSNVGSNLRAKNTEAPVSKAVSINTDRAFDVDHVTIFSTHHTSPLPLDTKD